MRRRLFNALCLLSLMLAVTLAALWVRSPWGNDGVFIGWPNGIRASLVIGSWKGVLRFQLNDISASRGFGYYANSQYPVDLANYLWLPRYQTSPAVGAYATYRRVLIPHWIPLLICLLLPMAWLRSRRRRARLARIGHCPACGYDLRGALGPTCPECGAAAAKHPLLSSAA